MLISDGEDVALTPIAVDGDVAVLSDRRWWTTALVKLAGLVDRH